MRSTIHPRRTRARGLAAAAVSAAVAISLAPAVASASADSASTERQVSVRLKVADQPAVEVPVTPRAWPTELMADHGIPVDGNDLVEVVRDGREVRGTAKRIRQGDTVRLVQVDRTRKAKTATIPAGVVEVPTTKLAPGRRKVVREGQPGLRRVVAVKTFHNGEAVKYRVVKRKTVEKPTPRRVLVGREPYSVPGADGLNWSALAGCESGGNPKAVNAAGYYGLYQFDIGTWHSVGGSGVPTQASAAEQTYRAKLLYKSRGRSPWPNCGRLL